MMRYYFCEICGKIFDEPHIKHTSYEDYFGAEIFGSRTPLEICVCPYCKSEEIEERKEYKEDDECVT